MTKLLSGSIRASYGIHDGILELWNSGLFPHILYICYFIYINERQINLQTICLYIYRFLGIFQTFVCHKKLNRNKNLPQKSNYHSKKIFFFICNFWTISFFPNFSIESSITKTKVGNFWRNKCRKYCWTIDSYKFWDGKKNNFVETEKADCRKYRSEWFPGT